MRVLITNLHIWPRTGSVLYVRDLALELKRKGHEPEIFCLPQGDLAQELRQAGIPVEAKLRSLHRPDIIHGHHYSPTLVAVRHWRTVPAISVCHSHDAPDERAAFHPAIRRYYGVSRLCIARLLKDGVPPERAKLLLNFVDIARFAPRPALPSRPRHALVFSNYAQAGTHLPAVAEACRQAGLELDVVGLGVGNGVADPERILPKYDIVFAKAKAAIEAMAVGAAVVLCDYGGVGSMVTSENFDELRPLNFGFEALREPLRPEFLVREIARYDASDAALVRDRMRSSASLDHAVKKLVEIYHETVESDSSTGVGTSGVRLTVRSVRDSFFLRTYWAWTSLPPSKRALLERLGVSARVRALARKALGMG